MHERSYSAHNNSRIAFPSADGRFTPGSRRGESNQSSWDGWYESLKVKWRGWSTKALGRPLADENRDHGEKEVPYATTALEHERNTKHRNPNQTNKSKHTQSKENATK